ncbi:MAG TPA: hypothetical protein DHM90_06260 [Clostridiaceae bacterium]|nr:hypothetical protein [Clostridiaceae bacterium]
MKKITRRKVILSGVMKKGSPQIMDLGGDSYRITDELAKKMKLKSVLLFVQTLVLTLFYLFTMDKFRDIPFKGADGAVIAEGLTYTMIFLILMFSAFVITSVMIIPWDVADHMIELDEYEIEDIKSGRNPKSS